MIGEFGRNLFWALLAEFIVIVLAIVLRDDKRRMALVLAAGTLAAGAIAFGPQSVPFIPETLPLPPANTVPTATTRPLVSDYQTLSLQRWSELKSPETNLGLAPGHNYLLDIPFDTGWKASTQCSHLLNQPASFQVDTSISNPVGVYLLLQAGWGLTKYNGKQIGNVHMGFSDGNTLDIPLTLGFNIRDWAWENPAAVHTASSSTLQPAWKGYAPDGTPGGMDILTIIVPNNQSQSTLTSVRISDLSQSTTGDVNPCIHLVALTVKYLH